MNFTSNRPKPPVVPPASEVSNFTDMAGRGHPGNQNLVVIDPRPYPEVTGGNDPETVAMLKEDYAGLVSELTAITLYIFQNTMLKDESLANAILQIAIVEMTHLDMLADAIVKLGGKSRFENGHYFWNASYVDYAESIEGMMIANIKAESGAIESYQKHAMLTKNKSVHDLLLRIAEDEKLHLAFFQDVLARFKK